MSVVPNCEMEVVERAETPEFDNPASIDVIADPQALTVRPTHLRTNHFRCFVAVHSGIQGYSI
jgi:hypothetical protein